jgi:ADP-heptose:LPS heptosyltransferase
VALAVRAGAAHRVLVIRALGLGDLLTAVPALRALRRGFPDSEIMLASPDWLAPLIPLIGAVDRLVDTSGLDAVRAHGPAPDLVVNLHGSGPQSIAAAVRLGPAEILTHAHPAYPELPGPRWDPDLHEIDRWCSLIRWAGFPADRYEFGLAQPSPELSASGLALASPHADKSGIVVVHPGASAVARRWPADRFAAVASSLADRGLTVVITGSGTERELARRVVAAARHPGVRGMPGLLRLDDLAALVAAARLVVCGDTGVAHLATAYGTPSVVLFGPTPPGLWGPPESGPHRVLWHGGRGDPHGARPDPGLLTIGVDEVLDAAEPLLQMVTRR